MADDRAALDPTEQLAKLQRDFDDLKSTILARASRLPTGSIEPVLLTAAKADTLLMQGQAVSRTDYGVLWQWVQDNSLVVAGLFTVGDGSTTFGLPDFRGRVPRGVAAAEAVGALTGADTKAIAVANLPAHDHNVSVTVAAHSNHAHGISADDGNHGFHNGGAVTIASALPGYQDFFHDIAADTGVGNAAHSHTGSSGSTSGGTHSPSVTETSVGSGTAFDVRQASINVNWLIWT